MITALLRKSSYSPQTISSTELSVLSGINNNQAQTNIQLHFTKKLMLRMLDNKKGPVARLPHFRVHGHIIVIRCLITAAVSDQAMLVLMVKRWNMAPQGY